MTKTNRKGKDGKWWHIDKGLLCSMYGSIEQSGPLCSRGVQLSSHTWGQVQSTLNSRGDLEPWDLMARVSVDWYYSFEPWLQTIAHTGSVIWFSHSQLESFTFRPLTLCKAGSVLLLSPVSHLWTYRSMFIYYFIFGCAGLSLLCGLSLVVGCGGYSSLQCVGFSLRWLLLLRSMGSGCAGFSSGGSWA